MPKGKNPDKVRALVNSLEDRREQRLSRDNLDSTRILTMFENFQRGSGISPQDPEVDPYNYNVVKTAIDQQINLNRDLSLTSGVYSGTTDDGTGQTPAYRTSLTPFPLPAAPAVPGAPPAVATGGVIDVTTGRPGTEDNKKSYQTYLDAVNGMSTAYKWGVTSPGGLGGLVQRNEEFLARIRVYDPNRYLEELNNRAPTDGRHSPGMPSPTTAPVNPDWGREAAKAFSRRAKDANKFLTDVMKDLDQTQADPNGNGGPNAGNGAGPGTGGGAPGGGGAPKKEAKNDDKKGDGGKGSGGGGGGGGDGGGGKGEGGVGPIPAAKMVDGLGGALGGALGGQKPVQGSPGNYVSPGTAMLDAKTNFLSKEKLPMFAAVNGAGAKRELASNNMTDSGKFFKGVQGGKGSSPGGVGGGGANNPAPPAGENGAGKSTVGPPGAGGGNGLGSVPNPNSDTPDFGRSAPYNFETQVALMEGGGGFGAKEGGESGSGALKGDPLPDLFSERSLVARGIRSNGKAKGLPKNIFRFQLLPKTLCRSNANEMAICPRLNEQLARKDGDSGGDADTRELISGKPKDVIQ